MSNIKLCPSMTDQIDAILNHAPCGFLSFTDDKAIAMVNDTLLKLLGYEIQELQGKSMNSILPIAGRIFCQTHFFPLLNLYGKAEEIYFSLRSKQGVDIPMLVNAVRRQDQDQCFNDCIFIPINQHTQITQILKKLAEWGMGSHVVNAAINNPGQLKFQRFDRTILFMDIRGFTAWCEQREPDLVATVLNNYYRHVEPVAAEFNPLKISFTADEIMAIYATPKQGVKAAIAMQKAASEILKPEGISTGCAVHCGNVIEGLFGGTGVRTYTVIGDVVNTAKRLEGATPASEITISDTVYLSLSPLLEVEAREPIHAKGKTTALKAWKLIKFNPIEF